MTIHRLLAAGLGVLSLALAPAARGADQTDVRGAGGPDRPAASPPPGARTSSPPRSADDAEFFRRVHLDLAGRIPSVTEVRDFLDDDRPDKRRHLGRPHPRRPTPTTPRTATPTPTTSPTSGGPGCWPRPTSRRCSSSRRWRRGCGSGSRPTSATTRSSATCSPSRPPATRAPSLGGPADGSPAAFFQANEFRPENLAGSTARLFLGVQLECAQCHDHPFAKWTREQFWEYAAFFAGLPQQPRPAGASRPAAAAAARRDQDPRHRQGGQGPVPRRQGAGVEGRPAPGRPWPSG